MRREMGKDQTAKGQEQLQLQLEYDPTGVRQGQRDYTVLGGLEVDMVLNGEIDPLIPSSSSDTEC